MQIPKTLILIECRMCNGSYYGGDSTLTLNPGTPTTLPDEISIVVRKVGKCTSCKENEDRTRGQRKKRRFER